MKVSNDMTITEAADNVIGRRDRIIRIIRLFFDLIVNEFQFRKYVAFPISEL